MQSKARTSGPQPSGSHPARVDLNGSKDQAQNLSGRKAEASGPVAPAVGQRCQMVVRMLAYPVSLPFQKGELAESASRTGRSRAIR